MTIGQSVVLIILGIFSGISIGQLIGQAMHYYRIKKISQTKCRNCKFFYECQGCGMKHLDEKNDCKTFQPAEHDESEVERLSGAVCNLASKFKENSDHLESLANMVKENSDDINSLYTIASDNDNAIQEVSRAVFDNDKEKPNSNTEC